MSDKSFGEFFDEVKKTDGVMAEIFMKRWVGLVPPSKWEEIRLLPLDMGMALNFAEDMAAYYQATIRMIESPFLYEDAIREGHEFLQGVHSVMEKFGLEIDIQEIDVPLTPSEVVGLLPLSHSSQLN